MTNPQSVPAFIAYARKAFAAALVAVVGVAIYLTSILSGTEGLGDVTVVEWLGGIIYVAASFGITFATPPNAPKVR